MSNEHPKSEGVLFKNNERTKDSHPNMRGHIEVTKDQINRLIEMARAGNEPKLQLACWFRKSKSGMKYMFLSTEAYMKQVEPEPEDDFEDDFEEEAEDHFADDDIPF